MIVLGTVRVNEGLGSKQMCMEKNETMMYVPILKTLDILLQNETVL